MDLHRLRVLLELSRLGSMHAVALAMHTSTSTVSQQIATLAREAGAPLVEPAGRRVRLTPAGRRLADHAVTILAAVDAARLDLDPGAEPSGTVRVAGFATAIRRSLLPAVADLSVSHPGLEMRILEYEPFESLDLLAADDVDLALVYDYNLAPLSLENDVTVRPLWDVPWGLGVPATGRRTRRHIDRATDLAEYADHDWIVNSRNTADEDVVRTLASMVGFTPRVVHRIDSLELLEDLVGGRPRGRAAPPRPRHHQPRAGAAADPAGCAAAGVRRRASRPRGLAAAAAGPGATGRRRARFHRPAAETGARHAADSRELRTVRDTKDLAPPGMSCGAFDCPRRRTTPAVVPRRRTSGYEQQPAVPVRYALGLLGLYLWCPLNAAERVTGPRPVRDREIG